MRRKIAFILCLLALATLKPSGFAEATSIWPLTVELSAAPGATATGSIRLTNNSKTSVNYLLSARDFSPSADESGTPIFTESQVDTHSIASWIRFENETVSLVSGESREVHFTIPVPAATDPGGYYTAVLFSENTQAGNVPVNTQVGALVFLNVTGNATTEGSLASFTAPRIVSHLPEVFSVRITNNGQTTLVPAGTIVITNVLGAESAKLTVNPDAAHVLQNSTRNITATWQNTELPNETPEIIREWNNFGFGYYRATLALNLGTDQTINAQTSFWIVPWQLILSVVALILIISFLAKRLRRK